MKGQPLKVGLIQISNGFAGQNYLPYSVASLRSHAQGSAAVRERFAFLPFAYKREPIRQIVERMEAAAIVGFSTYVWNVNASLEAARRIKARWPEKFIIFGGPQVPDRPEAFLRAHPWIDLLFHKEGERAFTRFLECFEAREWQAVPGVSFLAADGRLVSTPPGERIRDLAEIPSPFLNGIFDELIAAHPQERWIGLWETNRGCPFSCSYCDWGAATAAKVNRFEMQRLLQEADWFSQRRIGYVFVCDANFGILPRDLEIARRVADNRRRSGYPEGFSVQNTKNATERAYATQKLLAEAGLSKGVALSMQSLSAQVLKNIGRENISLESYVELQGRFSRDGIETFSDLILGLPGETYESFAEGVDRLIRNGQHNRIQFNNCAVLPNTEMADEGYVRRFGIETVTTEIVNIHGRRDGLEDDVAETQELVVATASLPREAWRRCRVFAWMTAFLHFDKLLQIPLVVAHALVGVSYREMIEAFVAADGACWPLLGSIRDLFRVEAAGIQAGGAEYTYAEAWLGIYWPADEYAYIRLAAERSLDGFYAEAAELLEEIARRHGADAGTCAAVAEAVELNARLIHRPHCPDDVVVELAHDLPAFYRARLRGEVAELRRCPTVMRVERSREHYDDFQRWCREIVWWGNKRGAYLYGHRRQDGGAEGGC